ncbi:MarR family winged helix-turn-helix transcriptional regulator [Sorangium cellulosum]|uniref:MarR family transcriptional regulator n=1 Tax=Sorangium cellulosum TaxID=56 RepID=A0A150QUG6_SORCE|nr:MarR family transcriptional regulator [Sorangium cellulosum]KYF71624.1 MarR family transcriptional regulator [Sorangium cellulosum]
MTKQDLDPSDVAELDRRKRASLGQLLLRSARLLDERAVARVARGGSRVRRAHTALMPYIDLEGTRLTDLAERARVTKQAVGQLVEELEAMGVVERTPDPDDGRAKRVRFTPYGLKALLHGLGVLQELEEELTLSLGQKQMASLKKGLTALLAALEASEASEQEAPPERR